MTKTLRAITGWEDPALPALMDIYQESFPPDEQLRLSKWVDLLNSLTRGENGNRHLLAWEEAARPLGLIYYEAEEKNGKRVAYLWYLATDSRIRGQGIGAALYQAFVADLFARGFDLLLFEVEKPEIVATHGAERADFAARRLRFYRRNGAKLLEGIHYVQDVGWQPPMEMHLMVHTPAPVTAREAYSVVRGVLGDAVSEVGPLTLS